MRVRDVAPSPEEQEAYCDRLNEVLADGGHIDLVQLHTVARTPSESWVSALNRKELEEIAQRVVRRTGLRVTTSL